MTTKYWIGSILIGLIPWLLAAAGTPLPAIGIVLPQGQSLPNGEAAETLRQTLMTQFKTQSVEAVPLTASANNLADQEAQAKHLSYVLYTHVTQARLNNGISGGFAKMKAVLSGPAAFAVKSGDILTLEYRLIPVGSTAPIKSESFNDKAEDGQVSGNSVGQLVRSVVIAAQSAASDPTAGAAAAGQSGSAEGANSSGRSPFGGLFGHRSAPKSPMQGAPGAVDCSQMASLPGTFVSKDACEKFKGAQQTYTTAAADPSAARPGDEEMTCSQINEELKKQQIIAPDKTQVAEMQNTSAEMQTKIGKEVKEAAEMQAKDQAAVNAANAADRATELATGGLVRGRALEATEKTLDAEHRAANERIRQENNPTYGKLNSQTADMASDFASQMQSNPRLARLLQLANSKRCKGGG